MKTYVTYVRPLLEYAACVWSPYQLDDIAKIESAQRRLKPRTHDQQMLANMCLPTVLANKSLSYVQKVGKHFMLANKRQTVRCDWLAVVNIMAQNGRMRLMLTQGSLDR